MLEEARKFAGKFTRNRGIFPAYLTLFKIIVIESSNDAMEDPRRDIPERFHAGAAVSAVFFAVNATREFCRYYLLRMGFSNVTGGTGLSTDNISGYAESPCGFLREGDKVASERTSDFVLLLQICQNFSLILHTVFMVLA